MEKNLKMLNIEKEKKNILNIINVYEDNMVKNIFKKANEVAELHAVLTSGRGKHFRLNLLHGLATKQDLTKIEEFKNKVRLKEYKRHIDKLLEYKLIRHIRNNGKEEYIRTKKGENAINTIRELQRRIKRRVTSRIFKASLGVNSIRLFLRVYNYNKEISPIHPSKIIFKPSEIGRLSLFLPRTVEGFSAIDKLNVAGLLIYKGDNSVEMDTIRARSFYKYLERLYSIL